MRSDVALVDLCLSVIGDEYHDHVSPRSGFSHAGYGKTGGFGFGARGAGFVEPDFYLNAAVFEVEGMGVALGSVSDDGNLLALDERNVRVFFVVKLSHLSS